MGWSAWDVGTVFALGGWLADHHAENTARQVAAALAEHGSGRGATQPLGAAHPPPPSPLPPRRPAYEHDWDADARGWRLPPRQLPLDPAPADDGNTAGDEVVEANAPELLPLVPLEGP